MDYRDDLHWWSEVLPSSTVDLAVSLARKADTLRKTGATIYPVSENVFRAYVLTEPADVKCVIIGQDPYHGAGQAHGLSFSVPEGCAIPPSLRNIFKELSHDMEISIPLNGNLTSWAYQGVLLLNTTLTVEEGKPNSHADWGWSELAVETLKACEKLSRPIVYILWGAHAKQAAAEAGISNTSRNVIYSPHPSPLSASRGFFGSRPFSRANRILAEMGVPESELINWNITSGNIYYLNRTTTSPII